MTKADKKRKGSIISDPEIRAEYDRLFELYRGAHPDRLELARKLIARAAFLAVTIDRMEEDISENGYEEAYQNGANQHGMKKSAAADLHVSYSRNLFAAMKQLTEMLEVGATGEGDSFESF